MLKLDYEDELSSSVSSMVKCEYSDRNPALKPYPFGSLITRTIVFRSL